MKIKTWWEDYKLKKSFWSKLSDIIFIVLIVGMLFPSSRMFIISNFQRITMWGPSELSNEKQVQLADEAYNWQLQDSQGNQHVLAEFKGKVIFINLWATWCPPCVAEMPSIDELYAHYKDNPNIVFLLVTNEKRGTIDEFLIKRNFNFPIYSSLTRNPQEFFSETIPATFVVDKNGRVVMKEQRAKKWHGESTIEFLDKLIAE